MSKDIKAMLARKLAENSQRHAAAVQEADFDPGRQHLRIPVEAIEPNPYQPRRVFPMEEIESLAASISEAGLLQPISVRRLADDKYQLIAGERRLRAHKVLGRHSIEAIVVPAQDSEMAVLALAENMDREDLSDYEIGKALRQVETLFPTKTKLAEALGLNREDMYRYYAFESLPDGIRERLDKNPRLLARSAAADIKRALQELSASTEVVAALEKAWGLLEVGSLEQTKIAAYIRRAVVEEVETAPSQVVKLTRSGQKVGAIRRTVKGLVVQLDAAALNPDKESRLRRFVEQLVGEGV